MAYLKETLQQFIRRPEVIQDQIITLEDNNISKIIEHKIYEYFQFKTNDADSINIQRGKLFADVFESLITKVSKLQKKDSCINI